MCVIAPVAEQFLGTCGSRGCEQDELEPVEQELRIGVLLRHVPCGVNCWGIPRSPPPVTLPQCLQPKCLLGSQPCRRRSHIPSTTCTSQSSLVRTPYRTLTVLSSLPKSIITLEIHTIDGMT